MADLRELYQQVILDHYKNPRNYGRLESATQQVEGYNPLCGDHYTIFVDLDDATIRDISFDGSGCAISKASASVMSSSVKGKSREEAEEMFRKFRELMMGEGVSEEEAEKLGRLAAFLGVREHPSRIKCATLAWHALHTALTGEGEVASTE
ncbi:MAG TPA: SUF system NifU family Fe-S cluster assembly protein [Thermoanaerobaculia bacterium]|nr:SUF system NifU family Fe-S cluster assembly protein [Thermoanaerobaculia bacterium]